MAPGQPADVISAEDWPEIVLTRTSGDQKPIHFWEDGLNTGVRVKGDGRLDINFREHKPSLAGLLPHIQHPPALAGLEATEETPSPDVVPDSEEAFPLHLNIVIHVVGSRGDVQPFVALGKKLKEKGQRVRLATHLAFRDFVLENGLEFFSIGGDPAELMAFMVKNPGLMPDMKTIRSGAIGKRRRDMKTIIDGCWRSCFETGDGTKLHQIRGDPFSDEVDSRDRPFVADAIIANPPSMAHIHCVEKLGIPLNMVFTMPWSPTQAFPHPLANIRSHNTKPSVANFASYAVVEMMIWEGLGDIINKFRTTDLGLDPLDAPRAPSLVHRLRIPYTYLWSPALLPKPTDWEDHIDICGFSFLPSGSAYIPPDELVAFLNAGPPPIYIGFGSIVVDDPIKLTKTVFDAIRNTGQRALVSKGWGHLGGDELQIPENVLMLGNCPHDWLFKHVSCVIHHGGAGTTAIGLALGCPTIIVPFFGDQPFWGSIVARAGAGPDPIPHKELTTKKLTEAILDALKPETRAKAREIGERMQSESGVQNALASMRRHLGLRTMRCALCPDKPAVWHIKHSPITLSAFAATVLVESGLLEPHNVEIYRTRQYDTCRDPGGPIEAGTDVLVGTIGRFLSDLAALPIETVNALSSTSPHTPGNGRVFSSKKRKRRESSDDDSADGSAGSATEAGDGGEQYLGVGLKGTITRQGNISEHHGIISATVVHTSRISKRVLKGIILFPMDLTLSLSKGFHNLPKMYHDDTVEPIPNVVGVRSGFKAAGTEFTHGFYHGVTGIATQPYRGFQKSGTRGLAEGVGKGIGGIILKPFAGIWGLAGYPLAGLHRILTESLGRTQEHHIALSRIAQGYDEMRQSSAEERAKVTRQWRVLRSHLEDGH